MQPATVAPYPNRTILIVEDDAELREALRGLLEDEGFRVLAAGNGLEALQVLAREDPPFLILLDLVMPVMDGWQLQAEIEKSPRLAEVPIIVLSNHVKGGVIAGPRGVRFAVQKPVAAQELLAYVGRYRTR